jgi:uncharacterized YccA/Bax inhibitor family protein
MRTSNPALSERAFQSVATHSENAMTVQGAVNKTMILLGCLFLSAGWVWTRAETFMPFLWPAAIGGFILALIVIFNKTMAPVLAPVYAVVEGLLLGALSAMFEAMYPGIVIQAVGLTFGILLALLLSYTSGLIKVTARFRRGVIIATFGIALYYIFCLILGFFNVRITLLNDSGPLGIGFSLFVVVIASLNLTLDFDFIERGAEAGAPKYMEWYGAFGLIVTLVWLYMEILRLLSKLRRR